MLKKHPPPPPKKPVNCLEQLEVISRHPNELMQIQLECDLKKKKVLLWKELNNLSKQFIRETKPNR